MRFEVNVRRPVVNSVAQDLVHQPHNRRILGLAFEVFERVGGSYPTRIAGMVLGGSLLVVFWNAGTRHIVRQDPSATRAALRAGRKAAEAIGRDGSFLWKAAWSYLTPGFHPDARTDDRQMAQDWLASVGWA